MSTQRETVVVARGVGPRWLRLVLAVLATLYFVLLVAPLPGIGSIRPVTFFTQASCLFPVAAVYKTDYRLAAWSCPEHKWLPLDVRAYFPIRAEDKESRFYRLAHFYKKNHTVMRALDDYVARHHGETDDGVSGPIGGVRLFQVLMPIPTPGSAVARYSYEPLAPIPATVARDHYYTPGSERKTRCEIQ